VSTSTGGRAPTGGTSTATGGTTTATGGTTTATGGTTTATGGTTTATGGTTTATGGTTTAIDGGTDASGGTTSATGGTTSSTGGASSSGGANGSGGSGTGGASSQTGGAAGATSDAGGDASLPEYFPGSTIINATEGAMINGWVGTPTQVWKICYSTKLHTLGAVTFHTNCNFKGESVSIARVKYSTETRVIGGYNSGSWYSPATTTFSPNIGSFLFSVTNAFKHTFPGSNSFSNYLVLNNQYYGPSFGGGADWYIHSQMSMGTCKPGFTYACRVGTYGTTECNMDFCGTPSESEYFTLDVLEVWIK
jgi:hypothetical protein